MVKHGRPCSVAASRLARQLKTRRCPAATRGARATGDGRGSSPSVAPKSSVGGCSCGWPATPRRAVGARGAGLGGRRPGPRRHPPARHQDGGPRPHDRARPWPGGPARGGTRGPPPRAGAGRLEQRPARSRCSVRPRRHPKGQPAQLPPHLRELAGAAGRRSVRRGQADGARIHRWFSGTTGTLSPKNYSDAIAMLPSFPGITAQPSLTETRLADMPARCVTGVPERVESDGSHGAHGVSALPVRRPPTSRNRSASVEDRGEVVVPRDGVEPPTRGFSVRCSTS
jgi:hypothetical protein